MKIAILTFQYALNYGAVLQAFGLQRALKQLGIQEVKIINYFPGFLNETDQSLKTRLVQLIYFFGLKKKKKSFQNFLEKKLSLDGNKMILKDLTKLENKYDFFIVGSDQVWNTNITHSDMSYFLNFINEQKKKLSYAASFGVNRINEENKKEIENLLKNFNRISVREKQGVEIIKELLGKEVPCVLDPSLLINKKEWLEIAKLPIEKEYILLYLMNKNNSILQFARNLSKETGCKIVWINATIQDQINGKKKFSASPEEFLGFFAKAKYVVTNSFHGTVFSINFNKNFFIELLPPPSAVNSRLENVLDLFGLRDRQIINGINNNIHCDIDYAKVNQILIHERGKSMKFLKESIGQEINE